MTSKRESHVVSHEQEENISLLRRIGKTIKFGFKLINRPLDLMDDIWPGFRVILPMRYILAVGPYVVGIAGFVVHSGILLSKSESTYKACLDKNTPQRKTRIATGGAVTLLSLTGIGSSIALLSGKLGDGLLSQTIMPSILTGLLTCSYVFILGRKSYSLKVAKEEEMAAKARYEKDLAFRNLYCEKREARLVAERKVAYTALEFSITAIMLVGNILLASTLIASGGTAIGIVPSVLLIGGAIASPVSKIFEKIDSINEYSISRKIRNWVVDAWEHVFSSSYKNHQPSPATQVPSRHSTATMKASFQKENQNQPNSRHPSPCLKHAGVNCSWDPGFQSTEYQLSHPFFKPFGIKEDTHQEASSQVHTIHNGLILNPGR